MNYIRIYDVCLSVLLIILFLPVMLVLSLLIMIFIGYPPLYVSKRVGKNDTLFRHIKFKSMLSGKETGRVFFETDRINGLGKILRATHLDELPELFLILTGKMSFVGPRPLLLQHVLQTDNFSRHARRPGLTGLAQIYLQKKGRISKEQQFRLDRMLIGKLNSKLYFRLIAITFLGSFCSKAADMNPFLNKERIAYGKNRM